MLAYLTAAVLQVVLRDIFHESSIGIFQVRVANKIVDAIHEADPEVNKFTVGTAVDLLYSGRFYGLYVR